MSTLKSIFFSASLLGYALASGACAVDQNLSGPDAQVDASCEPWGSATLTSISADGSAEAVSTIEIPCEDVMSELPGIPAPEFRVCECETK